MELGGERPRPAAVARRMDFHRDPPAALVQLQSAGPAGDSKVPVAASLTAPEATLASDHEAAPFALLENLLGAEVNGQLQHRPTVPPPPARVTDSRDLGISRVAVDVGPSIEGCRLLRESAELGRPAPPTGTTIGCLAAQAGAAWLGSRTALSSRASKAPAAALAPPAAANAWA